MNTTIYSSLLSIQDEEKDFCKLIDIAVLKGQLAGLMKAWSILENGGNLKEEIKYIEQLLQNMNDETI